jgi:hypothetical protein
VENVSQVRQGTVQIFFLKKLFYYIDIKNKFKKIKKYILLYFQTKNTLNNYHYHNMNYKNTNVTAQPNMLYIVRFEPYRPHGFVFGDASPLISLTLQNTYNMLATSTTNKAMTMDACFRCGISQSPHLKTSCP